MTMLGLTFLATPWFLDIKKLRRIEHLQDQGFISPELCFSSFILSWAKPITFLKLKLTKSVVPK